MGFRLKLVRAGKAEARRVVAEENPYLAARREWDERYGDLITRARNWRTMALVSGLIALLATGGVVWLSARSRVVPFSSTVSAGQLRPARPSRRLRPMIA